ncbi:hypothetical protein [Mesorhizobium dulcispinae]|uniref:hypothetical protein n=1 Tax=Mesorhizobium dulcispinae TaxID=3072316 RepID=UPI0032219D06
MAFEFHRVVKNATNAVESEAHSIKKQVARTLNDAVFGSRPVATVPQMVAANPAANFGADDATKPLRIVRNIA